MGKSELRNLRGKKVGMVFQDPTSSLNPVLSIGDQLVEVLRRHERLSRPAAQERALELLERVALPDAARRLRAYPHELSGGMRQRVMIAIAISCRPQLLIADEPTTALDVTIQEQILSLLLDLQTEERMAMILVSHDLGVVATTSQRVVVMYGGFFVEEGAASELFRRPHHPYTRALLNALPELAAARADGRMIPIQGQPPDPRHPVAGCPFSPRCEFARRDCDQVTMELRPLPGDRATACPFTAEGELDR
jgi:oligopeptide transport system ATP-binding protein